MTTTRSPGSILTRQDSKPGTDQLSCRASDDASPGSQPSADRAGGRAGRGRGRRDGGAIDVPELQRRLEDQGVYLGRTAPEAIL